MSVRLWRRLQANLLQALLNEKINAVSTCGHGWLDRRHVSPVLLVLCALSNPLSKQLLLLRRECLMRLGRGHEIIRVSGKNALDQFALVRFSRDNRQLGNRLFAHVEAEFALALVLVRPMAKETVVGENGTDIAIVGNFMRRRRSHSRGNNRWHPENRAQVSTHPNESLSYYHGFSRGRARD